MSYEDPTYTVACPHEGCGATRVMRFAGGMQLRVGDAVPVGTADPAASKCLRCHRLGLRIVSAPERPPPPPPRGFTRIPDR